MGLKKDIEIAGGFIAGYHHISGIDWNKDGITTIRVSSYLNKAKSSSGIAAQRNVVTIDSPPNPLGQVAAYGILNTLDTYSGAVEE